MQVLDRAISPSHPSRRAPRLQQNGRRAYDSSRRAGDGTPARPNTAAAAVIWFGVMSSGSSRTSVERDASIDMSRNNPVRRLAQRSHQQRRRRPHVVSREVETNFIGSTRTNSASANAARARTCLDRCRRIHTAPAVATSAGSPGRRRPARLRCERRCAHAGPREVRARRRRRARPRRRPPPGARVCLEQSGEAGDSRSARTSIRTRDTRGGSRRGS